MDELPITLNPLEIGYLCAILPEQMEKGYNLPLYSLLGKIKLLFDQMAKIDPPSPMVKAMYNQIQSYLEIHSTWGKYK